VVLYDGKIAQTYFHSSSGGRTAAIQDEWPKAEPLPYLVPVADPYDAVSPYHDWGPIGFDARRVARLLKLPGPVVDLTAQRSDDGRAATVVASDGAGDTVVRGTEFRFGLGLRSTWIRIGVLALDRPPVPAVYGTPLMLTGRTRGAATPVLEERT